ncbi:MAG TPA: hypothetical protein VKQ52_05860 [Puia sp.]|nr:hypothetical protein [Puia sp.]
MSVSTSPSDSALSKMVIHSFSDKDFQQEEKDKLFTVPINPEAFTKNYKVDLDNRTGHGQPGTQPGYKSSTPEELKIDFVLDGTGTVEGYPSQYDNVSVHDQLTAFLDCVYTFNGSIHRPNFVIVIWGSEIAFPGTVSSVDLNHTLFLPNGTPLRIKVSVTFVKSESDNARAAANKLQSPDLTYYHRVQRGDRLDLLTFSKYNDPNYFLQVGRINNLVTVRKIAPPQELYFPPFAQNEP